MLLKYNHIPAMEWSDIAAGIPLFLASAVKFLLGIPAAKLALNLNFWQTLLFGIASSTFGIIMCTFFAENINKIITKLKTYFTKPKNSTETLTEPLKSNINKIIDKFGLTGLAFITPTIISIPIGTFMAVKYYKSKTKIISYMLPMGWLWSLIMALFLEIFPILKHYFNS